MKVDYSGEPGVELTYIKLSGESNGDAGGQYTGLDRFGRVVDQRWIESSSGTAKDRVKYGFNRASNRVWRENLVAASGEDEYYTYDGLYQLDTFKRGDLNAGKTGISGTPAWEEDFNYDPTGNWHGSSSAYIQKTNGTTGLNQNRTHNKANEITDITETTGTAWPTPSYDANGNTTSCPQPASLGNSYDLTWDAWNRLIKIEDGQTTVATYAYDGANRRTTKVTSDTRHYYYSDQWQIIEERIDSDTDPDRQFVWGLRYIDDLILRDRDTTGNGTLDQRLYVTHDYYSVTAILNTSGAVQERYGYTAFGTSRVMDASFGSRSSSNYDWETRYAAYYWDSESGLNQIRNRYLHSKIGGWLNRDPSGYQGVLNLTLYVENNPLNIVDPDGLTTFAEATKKCLKFLGPKVKAKDLKTVADCVKKCTAKKKMFKCLAKCLANIPKGPDYACCMIFVMHKGHNPPWVFKNIECEYSRCICYVNAAKKLGIARAIAVWKCNCEHTECKADEEAFE